MGRSEEVSPARTIGIDAVMIYALPAHDFMSISRDEALTVFHRRYPSATVNVFRITDTLPDNCAVYNRPTDCWFVLFSNEQIITRLQSSRLVAVSKDTGEIVYDGDANDEG